VSWPVIINVFVFCFPLFPFPDLQASTPAVVSQNDDVDDDDDEPLNEDDDDDEDLDGVDQGEELNTQHLILAQFDKVNIRSSCFSPFPFLFDQ
jgi:hypothetical protein